MERSCLLNALAGGRKLPNSARIGRRDSLRQKTVVVSFFFFLDAMLCGSKWKEGSDPRVLHMILRISGLNMPRDK